MSRILGSRRRRLGTDRRLDHNTNHVLNLDINTEKQGNTLHRHKSVRVDKLELFLVALHSENNEYNLNLNLDKFRSASPRILRIVWVLHSKMIALKHIQRRRRRDRIRMILEK